MAGQNVTFDFLTRGVDSTASGFRKVADNTVLAAKGAKILANVIETLGQKEGRTAAESALLAKALRETGVAEDRVTARAVVADAAIRRLDDAMKDSNKQAGGLGKTLSGLKLNPGLVGPLLALAPAIATLGGVGAGAAAGLGGAFIAGGAALAAFGAVAKPVLTDAKKAAGAVEKAQTAYNTAIANGVAPAKAFKAEQLAIAKAYAGMSPAQIALSKQLGDMADAWEKVKAAQTPVVTGALQPWLKSVTGLTSALGPIIAKVAPVIASLGAQFNSLVNSSAFKGFRDFIGATGSAAVSAGGSTIIDLVKSFMILLPKFDPLIREAIGWISRLGPAVLAWSSSKKASDDITRFLQWFSRNGPVVGGFIKNIGGALKALAPGLASGGALELKIVSDFLGFVAKLPPALAKPLAEVAGALLILGKTGVLKVGLQVVGPAVKWLSGGLINLGGGVTAGAEIRAAMVSGGAAAAAEIRAAMVGGGAAAGAEGAAGGAGAGAAAGKVAGGGFLAGFSAAVGPVFAGVLGGLLIRAAGDTLSPSGSFAGNLNKQFQADGHMWSSTLLHSFTFGGLEGWLTTKIGEPVGGALNNVGSGAKLWAKGFASSVVGFFSAIGHGAAVAFGHAGDSADALRTRNLLPLQGEVGKVSGGIQGLSGIIQGTMLNALRTAGQRSDSLRTQNLVPLRGELGRVSGGVQGLQASIDRLHGKNVTVGVTGTGSGGVVITTSGIAAAGQGNVRFHAAAGALIQAGSGPTADDVPAMLSRGELVVPAHMVRAGLADNLRGMIPGFAGGGFVGLENAMGSAVSTASALEGRGGAAAMAAGVKAAIAKEKAAMQKAATVASVGNYKPGAGVQQWRGVTSTALSQAGSSQQLVDAVLFQMQSESGGNPTIVNKWDSNWLAGHPSVGLMQVIRGTFQAYAGRYRNTGPFEYGVSVNPLANIYSAIKYAQANYGPGLRNAQGGIGSGHGYAKGGLVPGYASGGVAGQGAAWLKAWQDKRGGGYGAAWGPVVVNEQIAQMTAAAKRARTLAAARGLTPRQHRYWSATAADETRRLGVLNRELTTERAWRGQLGASDVTLGREIAAAGKSPGLAGPVKGWKTQIARQKATIAGISKMLGYSDAQRAAIAKAKPPAKPGAPAGPPVPAITHTYGAVTDVIEAFLQSVAAPLGAARGGLIMDRGGTLAPGFNPVWNMTGRPESLVPARGGGGVHLHLTVNSPIGSQQQLEDWFIRTANKTAQHGRLTQAVRAATR